MNTRYALVLLVSLLTACGGSDDGPHFVEVEIQDVSMTFFRSFSAGSYVFRSQTELEDAWAAAPWEGVYRIGIVIEEPPMPVYDFSVYTVVGLSHGIGRWCFRPNITSAFSDGTDLVVHYSVPTVTVNTLACMFDGPLISFVLVPRVEGTVEFVQDGS